MSRDFTRYEPWVPYPFSPHWTAFPPQVYTPPSASPENAQQNSFGQCECINGQKISANCNKGYVGVCDGPYGTRCICANLATGSSGCGDKENGRGLWCHG